MSYFPPSLQTLRDKLASGTPVIGIWSLIPSPSLTEVIGMAGMDFQILDREHGFYDLSALEAGIRACESAGCTPLVRMSGANPADIQVMLDLGAQGILVPQLTSAEAAGQFLRSLRFAPSGTRGLNPFTRAGQYGAGGMPDDTSLSGVLIENSSLYSQMDDLLALPDLDFVYLGVYDMSLSLGVPGDTDHPYVQAFVKDAIVRARAAGKSVGVIAKTEEEIRRFVDMGANMIIYGVDTFVIRRAMAEAVGFLRASVRG
ncbi:MAG: HpcH/HpaI aldolase family protein [Janthinobacterium lividum]